jgi:hypothetical protein
MSQTQNLTSKQGQVLALITSGFSATAAAERAGVHRNTVANWLRSEEFCEALRQSRREREILFWDHCNDLATEALQVLRQLMNDPAAPCHVRLRAAKAMLEHAQRYLPDDTCAIVTAPVDPDPPAEPVTASAPSAAKTAAPAAPAEPAPATTPEEIKIVVAVGMPVARHPPHRSVRAEFPHTAPI